MEAQICENAERRERCPREFWGLGPLLTPLGPSGTHRIRFGSGSEPSWAAQWSLSNCTRTRAWALLGAPRAVFKAS
eukprot:1716380-Pyramimonas_sp.AAC.1